MKRAMSMAIGAALAFSVAGAAHAATTSGKVVSSDTMSNTLTIQTDEGKRVTFLKDDATKIEQNGVTVALGDLKPAAKVTVTSDEMPSDPTTPVLATRVQVDEMVAAAATGTAPAESADYDSNETPVARHLPRTATPLPLITLFGFASLAAGCALRVQRRAS